MVERRVLNTLYLSYDGMTDPLGQSQVIPYLLGLSREGYSITLISFEKHPSQKEKEAIANILRNSDIEWIPLSYTKYPPIISTIWDIFKLKAVVKKLARSHEFRLVHCRSYITSFIGLFLKRNMKVPFIFDMRGFYADERVDGELWNLKNPFYKLIYRFFKKKEQQFISESDHVISLTESGKEQITNGGLLMKNTVIEGAKITIIPCSVDLNLFNPERPKKDNKRLLSGLRIGRHDKVLIYLGSIGTWYMVEEMLDFYRVFRDKFKNSRFLILTKDDPGSILTYAEKIGIEESSFIIRKAERSEIPLYLSFSDFSIFFIKPTFSKLASSPTKLGEILAMNVPIITNKGIGDVDLLVTKSSQIELIEHFNADAYSRAINKLENKLYDSKELRQLAERQYSLNQGVQRYHQVYKKLI